jgi:lipopolysaccharide biosynthesis protein
MKRLVLFAHYDAQGEVKRFIVHYLCALREHCDRIVFVSTAKLPPSELEKLEGCCDEIVLRDNVGFDFGMWRHAIDRTDLEAWDELVLTNSSVFGPLQPLGPIFERMAEEPLDLWGMTSNVEIAFHIQSYFLAFRRSILEAPLFRQFWASVLPFKDKDQVIRSYEVGLSRLLLDHGYRLKAVFPTTSLSIPRVFPRLSALRENGLWTSLREGRVNPTCGYPVELIRAGMPFVKAELLRDNPLYAELEPVLQAMEDTGFDMSLVEFDRPVKRNGAPPPALERRARRNGT